MTFRAAFRASLFLSLLATFSIHPASADSSHARVIRLSLVQGDVRFTREAHGDPLADAKAVWETAQANLPIRQGYVVATDNGRAEVEFENGALAFLSENTVLDFYDLSLHDGGRTTRLVLRQGSASFYVNPAPDDYFSVTGGDFTVEADGKTSFRLNNFDDGSNVNVLTGRISVLHTKDSTIVAKGQSFSMKAGEDTVSLGRLPEGDDFDKWVSGRIDTVSTATNASLQYTSSPYYAPGFADLYTYGSWFGCGGYGFGWRPFGASFGWSPFTSGQWLWDPAFGWTFASFQPWGWAPYHYGGWLFDASCGGWFYSPPLFQNNFYGNGLPGAGLPKKRVPPIVHPPHPPLFRASTAVFVRQNGKLGIVPMSPLDKEGKTPLNLAHGVFTTEGARLAEPTLTAAGAKWETVKSPAHDAMTSSLAATSAPPRVSRTLVEGNGGTRVVSLGSNSSIVYDPREHRFVNTNSPAPVISRTSTQLVQKEASGSNGTPPKVPSGRNASQPAQVRVATAPTRSSAPPVRSVPNPPAPRSSESVYRGGGGSSGYSGGGSSRGASSSAPSAPTSHASAPAASSGGGGRPH